MRALAVVLVVACGGRGGDVPPPAKKDGGVPDAPVLDIQARTLGMPDLGSYMWRKRGGHPAFRIARTAEAKNAWADVVTTCKQALTADPGHLEAAWLLAAGLGKLGKTDELLAPLHLAVAGDLGKWGHASLELPELQAFLKTPHGQAWQRRIETDRVAYIAALARSVIVASAGDLYAFDPEAKRWYRVTRTFGAVVGALRVEPTKIAYVTRQRSAQRRSGDDRGKATLAIGIVDLARGKTSRPIELGTKGPVIVTYSAKTDPGIWIGNGTGWKRLDDNYNLVSLSAPPKTRPPGPWLEVKNRTARVRALPVAGVTADWDDKGLASAIRIGKSNRVVSVPAPGLIDGNTAAWSPDRSRIAFVAQLDDTCAPNAVNAAAFVADATTGTITEIERAESMAIEWISDRKLMIDKGGGVMVFDLDGAPPAPLEGADGLLHPRRRPTCTPIPPEDVPQEPDPADGSGEPSTDAMVEPPG
ncbi:MAG: hypothetical protein H0V17_18415 [Deltaproteobacteria bacterium]|nr:hypothetical protein [Deltaproteobacteria bacterium]